MDDAAALNATVDVLNLVERERQEAQILEQPAPRGQGVGRRIGNSPWLWPRFIGGTESPTDPSSKTLTSS